MPMAATSLLAFAAGAADLRFYTGKKKEIALLKRSVIASFQHNPDLAGKRHGFQRQNSKKQTHVLEAPPNLC